MPLPTSELKTSNNAALGEGRLAPQRIEDNRRKTGRGV